MSGGSPRNRAAKGERDEPTAAASVAIVRSPIKGASDETHDPGGGAFAGRRAGGGGAAQIDNESGPAAVASIRAGRTVSRSRVELTARPTSPRAVSCPTERVRSLVRASNSLNKRTFSIAMTAWSAKVSTSSIYFLVNGSTSSL